jgi:hypothetical protein
MKNKKYIVDARREDKKKRADFISIVLLSENYGYRMKSYGPMSLLKIDKSSLIEQQINVIKSFFINYEVIVCCGFEAKKTIDYLKSNFKNENVRIIENQVYSNSNSCESARLCLNNTMNHRVLILHGDLVITHSMLNQIDFNTDCILTQDDNKYKNYCISVIQNNKDLKNMCVGGKSNFWADCLYLENEESISRFSNILNNIEFKNKFLFEAINELLKTTPIQVCRNEGRSIFKINNIKSLKEYIQNENIDTKLYK